MKRRQQGKRKLSEKERRAALRGELERIERRKLTAKRLLV
jgi:hypothetical protein